MIGELGPQESEALLRRQHLGHLGISSAEQVFVYPVAYGYDGSDIYIQSSEGLKIQLMRANPVVCVQVEDVIGPARWQTVMVHGSYEEIADEAGRDRAFAVITEQVGLNAPPSLAPFMNGPERMVAFRVRPIAITGRFEQDLPFVLSRSS